MAKQIHSPDQLYGDDAFAACRKVMDLLLLFLFCFVFRKLGGPPED